MPSPSPDPTATATPSAQDRPRPRRVRPGRARGRGPGGPRCTGSTCLLVARGAQVVGEWYWRDGSAEQPRTTYSVTEVGHQHARRDRRGRRRPGARRPRRPVRPALARHVRPQRCGCATCSTQHERPGVVDAVRLRAAVPGSRPHHLRRRPAPAAPPRHGVGLQQRRHPDAGPGAARGDRHPHRRVRRAAALRAAGHGRHVARHQRRRRHQYLRVDDLDLPGPGAVRPALRPWRPVRRASSWCHVSWVRRAVGAAVAADDLGLRPAVVAEPPGPRRQCAGPGRARPARRTAGTGRPVARRVLRDDAFAACSASVARSCWSSRTHRHRRRPARRPSAVRRAAVHRCATRRRCSSPDEPARTRRVVRCARGRCRWPSRRRRTSRSGRWSRRGARARAGRW